VLIAALGSLPPDAQIIRKGRAVLAQLIADTDR
jgi:hypothetical protein